MIGQQYDCGLAQKRQMCTHIFPPWQEKLFFLHEIYIFNILLIQDIDLILY